MQYSVAVRNARLEAIESTTGASPILKIRTGVAPAACATADSGTVLATVYLPADWMSNATNGVKTMLGTWEDASADGTGIAGHFRIYDTSGSVCHMQGGVTMSGGGGDMTVDNTNFAAGQDFVVTAFQITAGNA